MSNPRVISPMGWGSGAYVIHKELESYIPNYRVKAYNPYWTMFPFALQKVAPIKGADLIHTTSDYGIFFHVENIPLVLTIHGYTLDPWIRSYSTWAQKIHCATDLRLFTMMSLKKAAVVTAVSHYIARLAQEDLRMVLPIKVIYNGVDTKMFSPARYSMTHQNKVKVFFSGNLKVRKGSHWLPGIANKLNKNIRIFYTQGLRAQNTLPLSPNIESIGSVSFEQMPDRYRQMDILLMPTVREGFGLSVAEAMACGLPVVVSDCSSLPELIDHGKGGYLCPVGNVDTFAEKINFLAENPDLRKQMGEYNRAKVEMMFSLDQMIENYKKLFEETLDTWKK